MRIVGEIPHSQYKITLFSWNGKYLIKIEAGPYEQTYKIEETDIAGDNDMKTLVNEDFLTAVTAIFKTMHSTRSNMLKSL